MMLITKFLKIKNKEMEEIPLLFQEKYIYLKLDAEDNINFESYFKLLPKNSDINISSEFKSLFEIMIPEFIKM